MTSTRVALENEIKALERILQTTALTVAKENELIAKVKEKKAQLDALPAIEPGAGAKAASPEERRRSHEVIVGYLEDQLSLPMFATAKARSISSTKSQRVSAAEAAALERMLQTTVLTVSKETEVRQKLDAARAELAALPRSDSLTGHANPSTEDEERARQLIARYLLGQLATHKARLVELSPQEEEEYWDDDDDYGTSSSQGEDDDVFIEDYPSDND